ncbi:MAG: glycosyl hydrolase family 28-related protein [Bacteroidales bacterium]
MRTCILLFISLCCISQQGITQKSQSPGSVSVFQLKPDDPEAFYFTPERFKADPSGKTDVSDSLQSAINTLKRAKNFGILFIPEGKYLITKTIYIPQAIRLIGYGKNRPQIILGKNSPGFQLPDESDKGKAKYMFWFTSSIAESGRAVNDAGAGTFYSALSNIDLKIEDGNPEAVALRTHYAQHSFIAHCDIRIGQGKAGMFDVGNHMEDVKFFGGRYGIYTTKTSPGWQFMMLDISFDGQREAAIRTQQAGLTIVRMQVKNVPAAITIDENFWEKLVLEDCFFENISGPAIRIPNEQNANTSVILRNLVCRNVPVLAFFSLSEEKKTAPGKIYRVKNFIHGLQISGLDADPVVQTTFETEELNTLPPLVSCDYPHLPPMEQWVNVKSLGAKGDNETDDSKAIQEAIDKYPVIYIPQGWYKVSETLILKSNTVLIGLNPIATQFILPESTPAFSGFGPPKALLETPAGGTNIVSGIGLSTGEFNFRAVACKWMAGEKSMLDDVKFIGGHGGMQRGPFIPWRGNRDRGQGANKPQAAQGMDPAWDTQYWSLWITQNGGGIFKNIWTANTYANVGTYVSNTSTPGRIYAMSVEHHVRNEVRFSKVSNWKIYALQLEEESREGSECQPLEIDQCNNLLFANLYMFRVIRVKIPYPYSVRTWNCRNIEFLGVHNYTQVKYTTDNPLYDVMSHTEVRPWEFARLFISGNKIKNNHSYGGEGIERLATGFEFAEGMCSDSKGNVYFCEQRMKRIYKWSVADQSLHLLADYPWEPLSLACDTRDNLLVVFRYNPQYGHLVDGQQEAFRNPPDASGTSFSGWGNSGFATRVFSLDPENPDETLQELKKVPMSSIPRVVKALYPSNRWRDSHDFNEISVTRNEQCFVAPDGVTIIPECYDLARACALVEAIPGKPCYATDEYDKRVVKMEVDKQGNLSNLKYFVEKGEFHAIPDAAGNLYVADGNVYIFDEKGKETKMIRIPERPSSMAFGGDGNLFVVSRNSLFRITGK